MSSTPFHSFDAAAGSTFSTASASYGATSDGDQVDDMLADLAAELSDESYGAGAARSLTHFDPNKTWQAFIPTPLLSFSQFTLGGSMSETDNMAQAIAGVFEANVAGRAGGWSDDPDERIDIIDKAVKDSMFAEQPGLGLYAPLIALEYARTRKDLFPRVQSLEDLATKIWTEGGGSFSWKTGDVDDMIQDIVFDASKDLAGKGPAGNLGVTSEMELSEGEINELAVLLWLASEMRFGSYSEIANKLAETEEIQAHTSPPITPQVIDPGEQTFSASDYSEVAPEPPASGGFGMPRPQTILAFGYLLSAGGPLFQAAFGRKS